MSLITVSAHFDGQRIQLDEAVELTANTKLLVTILPSVDEERDTWARLSLAALGRAYGEAEPEYPLSAVKEANAEYAGG